jgi:hypothetical protein
VEHVVTRFADLSRQFLSVVHGIQENVGSCQQTVLLTLFAFFRGEGERRGDERTAARRKKRAGGSEETPERLRVSAQDQSVLVEVGATV